MPPVTLDSPITGYKAKNAGNGIPYQNVIFTSLLISLALALVTTVVWIVTFEKFIAQTGMNVSFLINSYYFHMFPVSDTCDSEWKSLSNNLSISATSLSLLSLFPTMLLVSTVTCWWRKKESYGVKKTEIKMCQVR